MKLICPYLFRFCLLALCSLGAVPSYGQQLQDTLREIKIKDKKETDASVDVRDQFTAGQQRRTIEKQYVDLYEMQSLANLIAQQTPVFVKSYGINGSATLSFRGASAAQSGVLWNGVPILNPALGVADISLLSTGLFDEVSLQYGSSAALYGSGNVGGALILQNATPVFKASKEASLTLGMGSFGRRDAAFKAGWQNSRWRIKMNGFYQQTKNDFPYTNSLQQEVTMKHARLQAGGMLLSADYNLRPLAATVTEVLSLHLWWQQYNRQIPPALFESSSVKEQQDVSLRSLISWQKTSKRNHLYIKASYNREYLNYKDGVVLPDNRNVVAQYYQEFGWRRRLDNPERPSSDGLRNAHQLLLFAPMQYAVASGEHISSSESQFRPALVAAYDFNAERYGLRVNAAVRQEWVSGAAVPLLPGAGVDFRLWSYQQHGSGIVFKLRGNVQRTYRIPTLNELYYFPGGNRNLKPEQGWNEDAGYTFLYRYKGRHQDSSLGDKLLLTHELAGFNRDIKDWVYWLGGAIWTPYNIASVKSQGLETDNKISYRSGKVLFHLSLKWAYTLSTTQASYLPGDGSTGKQIPYTPRYNGQGNVGFTWRNLFLNYNQTYTGYRFTTIDESQYLKPYQIGNIQAVYQFDKGSYRFKTAFQVQNIGNVDFQVVNGRPMPGRYFVASLQIAFLDR